jgi:hypothetical protein
MLLNNRVHRKVSQRNTPSYNRASAQLERSIKGTVTAKMEAEKLQKCQYTLLFTQPGKLPQVVHVSDKEQAKKAIRKHLESNAEVYLHVIAGSMGVMSKNSGKVSISFDDKTLDFDITLPVYDTKADPHWMGD